MFVIFINNISDLKRLGLCVRIKQTGVWAHTDHMSYFCTPKDEAKEDRIRIVVSIQAHEKTLGDMLIR